MGFLALVDTPTPTLTSLLLLTPVALLAYVLGLVIYRLYLHPLSKYPGPLWAKLTDLNQTLHAWRGDRHIHFLHLHETYGPVVRFGPNSLSFNSAEALKDVYGFKANVRKADFYEAFPATKGSVSTHSAIERGQHARKRRVLSQAFSDAALRGVEGFVLQHVRTFCGNLAGGGERNISDQANYLTFDVMGDLCFGKAFGMLEGEENRFAIDMIGAAAKRHLMCGTFLPLHEWHIDRVLFRKIAGMRERYMQFSKRQAEERMKVGMEGERKDFFYYLLQARDPETGKGFGMQELWGESNLLIIAGSDTTSTALAAAVFYLVHYPAVLRKLGEEVRGGFGEVEEIRSGAALAGCRYLRACIDEAMRLSPSVGGVLPRQVLPGDMEVDGVQVPEGTVVGVPHYAIHHNEEYYPQPFEYKPERWIAGSEAGVTAETVALAQAAFCPFSVGPRGCIGKGMAYMELSIALARMVFLYDMRLSPGSHVGEGSPELGVGRHRPREFQLKDTFTSAKDGPLVEFAARV